MKVSRGYKREERLWGHSTKVTVGFLGVTTIGSRESVRLRLMRPRLTNGRALQPQLSSHNTCILALSCPTSFWRRKVLKAEYSSLYYGQLACSFEKLLITVLAKPK